MRKFTCQRFFFLLPQHLIHRKVSRFAHCRLCLDFLTEIVVRFTARSAPKKDRCGLWSRIPLWIVMLLCWKADFLNPTRRAQFPAATADFSHAAVFCEASHAQTFQLFLCVGKPWYHLRVVSTAVYFPPRHVRQHVMFLWQRKLSNYLPLLLLPWLRCGARIDRFEEKNKCSNLFCLFVCLFPEGNSILSAEQKQPRFRYHSWHADLMVMTVLWQMALKLPWKPVSH